MQRLIVLDDLWTAELEAASGEGSIDEEAIRMLDRLGEEMRRNLAKVEEQSYEVRLMIEELSAETVDSAFRRIMETGRLMAFETPLENELPGYELRGAIITACDFVRPQAWLEQEGIRSKLEQIRESGEVPEGDLSRPFRCAALLMLVGAGVAATIGLGGAPVFIGLGTVSQVGLGALGWTEGKCSSELPRISFERR